MALLMEAANRKTKNGDRAEIKCHCQSKKKKKILLLYIQSLQVILFKKI